MIGIDVIGGSEGGLIGDAKALAKKAGAAILPVATEAASDALSDKPKDDASKKGGKDKATSDESFFTKTIVAPVKVWHALVGGVVAVGGAYWWLKR